VGTLKVFILRVTGAKVQGIADFEISGCVDLAKHLNLKISKSQNQKLNFTCLSSPHCIPLPAI